MAEIPGVPGPIDRRVGARLRARRETLRLSVDSLAGSLGCSVSVILDYESGRARIGAATLILLTRILGVDVGYFLGGLMDETPPPGEMERLARDKLIR